ncbi:uncharacterized protein H6S33_008221 [Morchella sextelata]|uniref:uncharacterized protein n=1 Tax=Morchella sextelata TaxID=1174677 RepID=UPI001D056508|nr:uncharacterized protein H6S33_008221 [Morchella sextelata]KAH0603217.1 hypothetical protein H6S33_008221 [Morchella sextelata]
MASAAASEHGASAHTATLTKEYWSYYRIPSLPWPPSSPDLNRIENVLNVLKNRLNQRKPRPEGEAEVKVAVLVQE